MNSLNVIQPDLAVELSVLVLLASRVPSSLGFFVSPLLRVFYVLSKDCLQGATCQNGFLEEACREFKNRMELRPSDIGLPRVLAAANPPAGHRQEDGSSSKQAGHMHPGWGSVGYEL